MPGYGMDGTDERKLLTWAWVAAQMAAARTYWVCTTRPDGAPHAAPVWGVWADETLYFATATSSRKARNLAADPRVAVHLESGDETVIFEGTAVQEAAAAVLGPVVAQYGAKYPHQPALPLPAGEAFYRLQAVKALAWLEADFPNTAVRFTFTDGDSRAAGPRRYD